MNCANHSDTAAVAYCRTCGKPLCSACSRNVGGVVYCETCVAEKMHGGGTAPTNPPIRPVQTVIPPQTRPVVAGLLGFIPGVGAMYNGQFMKGVIHALTFVVLIFITTHIGIVGILIGFFVFYMVFDAFKTAEAIQQGRPLPDPFGLEGIFGPGVNQTTNWQNAPVAGPPPAYPPGTQWTQEQTQGQVQAQQAYVDPGCQSSNSTVPLVAVILIGLGCIFLLDSMGVFSFDADRYWPFSLIIIGGWLFYKRWNRVS
jgi:TM2 domain-containing membrane protein YozV